MNWEVTFLNKKFLFVVPFLMAAMVFFTGCFWDKSDNNTENQQDDTSMTTEETDGDTNLNEESTETGESEKEGNDANSNVEDKEDKESDEQSLNDDSNSKNSDDIESYSYESGKDLVNDKRIKKMKNSKNYNSNIEID